MAALVFTLEGDHSDLEAIRTRLHGAIVDIVEDTEERRNYGTIEVDWEWED